MSITFRSELSSFIISILRFEYFCCPQMKEIIFLIIRLPLVPSKESNKIMNIIIRDSGLTYMMLVCLFSNMNICCAICKIFLFSCRAKGLFGSQNSKEFDWIDKFLWPNLIVMFGSRNDLMKSNEFHNLRNSSWLKWRS